MSPKGESELKPSVQSLLQPFVIGALGAALSLGIVFGVLKGDIQANTEALRALRDKMEMVGEIKIGQAEATVERNYMSKQIDRILRIVDKS